MVSKFSHEAWKQQFTLSTPQISSNIEITDIKKMKVLIINHIYFMEHLNLEQRENIFQSVQELERSFKDLGHEVEVYPESTCTIKEQENFILNEFKKGDFDGLILIIMSHGKMNSIAAYDNYFNIENILQIFDGIHEDKLKFIIVASCRGRILYTKKTCFPYLPIKECIVVHSVYPGENLRRNMYGSRFIISLKIALEKIRIGRKNMPILELLTDIKKHVSTKEDNEFFEMPIVNYNISKYYAIKNNSTI